jgi:hypothetical protein
MAKIPQYKCGIVTHGATMVGGASQIAYGSWQDPPRHSAMAATQQQGRKTRKSE